MSLGFMFPGQGSQAVGMLADVAAAYPQLEDFFERGAAAIGQPLWEIVRDGPEDRLNSTEITQPALLTASIALWEIWRESGGPRPALLAGHSLGEYSALVAAKAISFEDGVKLVHERGKLMQQAVPIGQGAMAAILGLDDDVVAGCCDAVDGVVAPANFNAPGQVVIAGASAAVDHAVARCKEAGARRGVLLPVSGPFHCELMKPAQTAFAGALSAVPLAMPEIPVVHNVDGAVAADLTELRDKLMAQIAEPVLWTRCVEKMIALGADRLVECGPGAVLCGLSKRIDRNVSSDSLGSLDGLRSALAP